MQDSPLDGKYPIPEAKPKENALLNEVIGAFRRGGLDPDCPGCGADLLLENTGPNVPLGDGRITYPCPKCGVKLIEDTLHATKPLTLG